MACTLTTSTAFQSQVQPRVHNSLEAPPVGLWPSVDELGQTTRRKASEKSLGRRAGPRVAALDMGPLPSAEWSAFLKAVDLMW